ncbi:hypothetical protein [Kitasatospora sp. NPDC057223]|uniref:hypothetical protein n=1 Tax=Kitasatospora sp. NPDC057223 TaxID=3346055 RepID=UPI00364217B4
MRRVGSVLAALVLLGGVVFAVLHKPSSGPQLTVVKGLIGSEKREFFADPEVIAEFRAQGLQITPPDTVGSWRMTGTDLKGYDFAFPASLSPAQVISAKEKIPGEPVRPFYSPLVVIAHASTAQVLRSNGLAAQQADTGVWTFKMDQYLAAVRADRTWQELKDTAGHAELAGAVYLTTTDPATSSSGALHLAAMSYLANERRVVSDAGGVARVKDLVRKVTAMQGAQKVSSDEPFKDFLSGVGSPLVLVYESQVAALTAHGGSTGDLVVLYPDTTVSSDHTVVGLSDAGRRMAELLRDNQKLRTLEAKFGFRPQADPAAFGRAVHDGAAATGAAGAAASAGPVYAPDLSAAGVQQAPVPAADVLDQLVEAAKGVKG